MASSKPVIIIISFIIILDHMREPSDIAVSGSEFFVCDFKVE